MTNLCHGRIENGACVADAFKWLDATIAEIFNGTYIDEDDMRRANWVASHQRVLCHTYKGSSSVVSQTIANTFVKFDHEEKIPFNFKEFKAALLNETHVYIWFHPERKDPSFELTKITLGSVWKTAGDERIREWSWEDLYEYMKIYLTTLRY